MIRSVLPHQVVASRAKLVDVREYPEWAAGFIPGSVPAPLNTLENAAEQWAKDDDIILVCRSGRRATDAAQRLARTGFTHVAVLQGGTEAWSEAGYPLEQKRRKPWSIERQVRTIAGSLVVLFTVLGLTVSPWLFALTLFVGAGLTFAGVSDICLMATLLGKLPWNRQQDLSREKVSS